MKPNYKNWMPRGMVYSFLFAALGCGAADRQEVNSEKTYCQIPEE